MIHLIGSLPAHNPEGECHVSSYQWLRLLPGGHTYPGFNQAKISPEEIAQNRKDVSGDVRINAAVQFAARIVRERGHVTDVDIQVVRDTGYNDGQMVEILVVTAENLFTHQLNLVVETDIDFPVVHAAELA